MTVDESGSTGVVEAARSTEVVPAPDVESEGRWQTVLEACRRVTRSRCAIAVNGEGLPLAWVGDLDEVAADRVAAHVAKSFDLLDRLKYVGTVAECVCTHFAPEGRWLTAVRIAPKAGTEMTIALLGHYTLVESGRQRLRNTFLRVWDETRGT